MQKLRWCRERHTQKYSNLNLNYRNFAKCIYKYNTPDAEKVVCTIVSHTWSNRNNKLNWLSSMDVYLKTAYFSSFHVRKICKFNFWIWKNAHLQSHFISRGRLKLLITKFYLIMHESCLINLSVSLFNETFHIE